MRTSFELKYTATDYQAAKDAAVNHIGRFLGLDRDKVLDKVDIELKVELLDSKFEVTAHGKLKNGSVITPGG